MVINEYSKEEVCHVDLDDDRDLFIEFAYWTELEWIFNFEYFGSISDGLEE